MGTEAARKHLRPGEAAGCGDVLNGDVAIEKRVASGLQAHLEVVAHRRFPYAIAEYPAERADGDAGALRQLARRQRRLQVLLHLMEDTREGRAAITRDVLSRHPLGFGIAADALADKAVGHDLRQTRPMAAGDQVAHEIEGGDAAGACDAVAVDDIE